MRRGFRPFRLRSIEQLKPLFATIDVIPLDEVITFAEANQSWRNNQYAQGTNNQKFRSLGILAFNNLENYSNKLNELYKNALLQNLQFEREGNNPRDRLTYVRRPPVADITSEQFNQRTVDQKESILRRLSIIMGGEFKYIAFAYFFITKIKSNMEKQVVTDVGEDGPGEYRQPLGIVKDFLGGKKVRKHRGIVQTGGNKGRLRKGYKYSGKKLKNGKSQIVKVQVGGPWSAKKRLTPSENRKKIKKDIINALKKQKTDKDPKIRNKAFELSEGIEHFADPSEPLHAVDRMYERRNRMMRRGFNPDELDKEGRIGELTHSDREDKIEEIQKRTHDEKTRERERVKKANEESRKSIYWQKRVKKDLAKFKKTEKVNKTYSKELRETGKLAKKLLKSLQAKEKQVREKIDEAYSLSTPKQTIDLLNSLILSYREYELKKGKLRDDEVYGSIWTNNELDRVPLDPYGGNKKNKNKKSKKC